MTSADAHGEPDQTATAAEAAAMYELAIRLHKAHCYDESLTWYQKAAEAGQADAMHDLAIQLRYRGKAAEAATWWKRAGHEQPQRMTERLRGVNKRENRRRRGR